MNDSGLNDRQADFLVTAFAAAPEPFRKTPNGEQRATFSYRTIGAAIRVTEAQADDIADVLGAKELVQNHGDAHVGILTAKGRELARELSKTRLAGNGLSPQQESLLVELDRVADSNGVVESGGFVPTGYARDTIQAALQEIAAISLPNGGKYLSLHRNRVQLYKEARDEAESIRKRTATTTAPPDLYAGGYPGGVALMPQPVMDRMALGRSDEARAAYDRYGTAFLIWASDQFRMKFNAYKDATGIQDRGRICVILT